MSFRDYLKDKLLLIGLDLLNYILIVIMMLLFKGNFAIILLVTFCFLIPLIIYFIVDYNIRKKFFDRLENQLMNFDQKYLISELIEEADFTEAKIIKNITYDIDKCYLDHLNKVKLINEDFKDYIELWCHEIKTPIATEKLIIANNENDVTKSILEEVKTSEDLIEQVLFYARMDTLAKDYFISKFDLLDVLHSVIKRNKKVILDNKIKIIIPNERIVVESDPKWLEFIINQIMVNAMKYIKDNPLIKFEVKENKNNVILSIEDNGIGIKASELGRVFDKGFTGTNGRIQKKATGLGLYLAKKLCDKLGHNITIMSKENEYTKVFIVIPHNSLTNVIVTKE